jgi:hypothetical protein
MIIKVRTIAVIHLTASPPPKKLYPFRQAGVVRSGNMLQKSIT